MNIEILLVGAGPMAVEYAKVLSKLGKEFVAVGRGEESARKFKEMTGREAVTGGFDAWAGKARASISRAIVAVGEKEIGLVTKKLLQMGVKEILVEKPGGFDLREIKEVAALSNKANAAVYVGYNRRFYSSVIKAKDIIRDDGGVTSFNFEFTEWAHVINPLKKEEGVKERWFLHNSTHVIDLAFHLGGMPERMECFSAGGLEWHPSGSVFAGAGISGSGALFTYQANWEAPGRWGVEILTRKHRLIFRPMEKLQIQKIGSVAIEAVDMDYSLDTEFKPGLYMQTSSFINSDRKTFCMIEEQASNAETYCRIGNYK